MKFLLEISHYIKITGLWIAIGLGIFYRSFWVGLAYFLITLGFVAIIEKIHFKSRMRNIKELAIKYEPVTDPTVYSGVTDPPVILVEADSNNTSSKKKGTIRRNLIILGTILALAIGGFLSVFILNTSPVLNPKIANPKDYLALYSKMLKHYYESIEEDMPSDLPNKVFKYYGNDYKQLIKHLYEKKGKMISDDRINTIACHYDLFLKHDFMKKLNIIDSNLLFNNFFNVCEFRGDSSAVCCLPVEALPDSYGYYDNEKDCNFFFVTFLHSEDLSVNSINYRFYLFKSVYIDSSLNDELSKEEPFYRWCDGHLTIIRTREENNVYHIEEISYSLSISHNERFCSIETPSFIKLDDLVVLATYGNQTNSKDQINISICNAFNFLQTKTFWVPVSENNNYNIKDNLSKVIIETKPYIKIADPNDEFIYLAFDNFRL